MKIFPFTVIFFILAASAALAGCTNPVTDPKIAEMEFVTGQITMSLNNGLGELKTGIKNNSHALATAGLTGRESEEILAENLLHYPWAVSSMVISPDGTVVTAAPKNYAWLVGTNLSGQSHFEKTNAARVPGVSKAFLMDEGFTGISQTYPIFSPSGKYLGYTDITYAPDAFIGRNIEWAVRGTDYDVWVVQTDGTEIFDTNKEEIGKNILTDPAYADPALKKIIARIVKEPAGNGEYIFQDRVWNRNVTKIAVWNTAGIDGTEWRVVVTSATDEGGVKTTGVPANAGDVTDTHIAELNRFVEKAAAFAQEHGKEAALREFNNPNGTFIEGDLYVFAYDMNGTVIALPYQQGLLGTDRTWISDPNGVEYIDRMIEIAREGGGPIYYIYPNPRDNYREEFKLSYVLPVDNEWFIGSGIYVPDLPARFDITERDQLIERVKQARGYAQKQGREKAVLDFNDRKGAFADGSRYIFAYSNNGTTLALPFQQGLIGSNRLNFTDEFGVKTTEWEISAAKRGGGFVYVDYINPDTGTAGLKLCYVAPVDDEWFVGSGIYTLDL